MLNFRALHAQNCNFFLHFVFLSLVSAVKSLIFCVSVFSGSGWRQDDSRKAAGGSWQSEQAGRGSTCCMLINPSLIKNPVGLLLQQFLQFVCFLFQVNVWTLQDPYAVLAEDKPFKSGKLQDSQVFLQRSVLFSVLTVSSFVGKCYKVPDSLDDGGKRKRKRPSSLQDFRSWFRGICENTLSFIRKVWCSICSEVTK